MSENKLTALEFFKSKGHSKYQESFAEYSFLKDLLLAAATNNEKILVSRSDFDDFGFDVIVGSLARQQVLHVQLKAVGGTNTIWDVHQSLIRDDNGRVVIIKLSQKDNEIESAYYMLNSGKREKVLNTPPIINHAGKCKLNILDCDSLAKENLLEIFN